MGLVCVKVLIDSRATVHTSALCSLALLGVSLISKQFLQLVGLICHMLKSCIQMFVEFNF